MKKGTWIVIDGSVRKMKPGITLAFMQDKYPDKRIDKCHKPPSINQMEEWMGECGCGPFVILDAGGGLTIGDYVSISSGVHIYTHDSVKWALSGGVEPYESGAVDIGDCCHIGANSVVARGVKIGHHSVVGAASFVRTSVEPYSIVSGVPAQMIGTVTIVNGRVQYAFK